MYGLIGMIGLNGLIGLLIQQVWRYLVVGEDLVDVITLRYDLWSIIHYDKILNAHPVSSSLNELVHALYQFVSILSKVSLQFGVGELLHLSFESIAISPMSLQKIFQDYLGSLISLLHSRISD